MENNQERNDDFIKDLDEYFAKKFSDFDLIGSLPSYESVTVSMILKNKNRIEEGEYAANEMRKIAYQPNVEAVLAECKEKYVDNTFTFSVHAAPFKVRFPAFFGKKSDAAKTILRLAASYGEDAEKLGERLHESEKIWEGVLKGYFIPEKLLVYRITLLLGLSREDNAALMRDCGCHYDFSDARDVVMRYLVDYRVYNPEMAARAFDEYHIRRIL